MISIRFVSFFVAVGNGDGSDLSVEIVQNGQIIYKVVFNQPGTNYLKTKGDSLKVIFDEKDNLMVVGDTKVRFHSSNTVSSLRFFVNIYKHIERFCLKKDHN